LGYHSVQNEKNDFLLSKLILSTSPSFIRQSEDDDGFYVEYEDAVQKADMILSHFGRKDATGKEFVDRRIEESNEISGDTVIETKPFFG
jgi:hypothetical protein